MESSVYYPQTHPDMVHERGIRIAMTPQLASDVPMGYFSWAEFKFMQPIPEVAMQQRMRALKSFADGES